MKFWSNKKVFVTGATGFVGYWLIRKLVEQRATVVALIRDHDPQSQLYQSGLINQVHVVSGSVETYDNLARALCEYEIDTVFHLAAQTIVGTAKKAPLITFESNIRGTYCLLEACRHQVSSVERIVLASSDKAYGKSAVLPYIESMPLMGSAPYDVSKSCCDLIAQSYFHTYNLPLTIARCGNIFGGGDLNWSRIIPSTIRSLFKKERPILRSDGTCIRDYIYVKDVIEAYLLLAEHTSDRRIQGEGFNFAPSKPYTVLEIVHILQKMMGYTHIEPLVLNQARDEIEDQFLSCKKAKTLLGWYPQFDLASGLTETIEWYSKYLIDNLYQNNLKNCVWADMQTPVIDRS